MSKEYFWGDALTSTKKEIQWNPSMDDDEDEFGDPDEDAILHFLFLKQAVLGPTAKEGERNVVEITTEKFDGDEIKQPLFSLKVGLNESTSLDIGVQPPVTFTLISGSGPVHLSGQHMIEINADDEDEDLEEEDEEEDEDLEVTASPELKAAKTKKRPLSTSDSAVKKSKIAKLDKDLKKDEEGGEEEEDADMAEMEDDDEEDDEDFEGEEDEDEDSDEDEDEDGDEEEDDEDTPEKPVTKKKGKKSQINGTSTANVEGKGDNKVKAKGPKKLDRAKGKKKIFSIDEIKQKLQASSNVPKKEARFKNYLQSTFHISEAKKLQDLWGWYRASIPN